MKILFILLLTMTATVSAAEKYELTFHIRPWKETMQVNNDVQITIRKDGNHFARESNRSSSRMSVVKLDTEIDSISNFIVDLCPS